MNEKLIRPIFRFFNNKTKNAEFYKNHGSVWLIFTKEKRWVFELTKEGTLWYNYYLFNDVFKYFSLDVVKNQDYITKWVENIIQNGVIYTVADESAQHLEVGDTIQNGVKYTHGFVKPNSLRVGDTIQNGVKYTRTVRHLPHPFIEDTIQNGVQYTLAEKPSDWERVEDTIQNGIKHTEYGDWLDGDERLDDIIENGVKETKQEEHHRLREVVQTVKDGVKETHWKRVDNHPTFVDRIIEITNPS